MFNKILSAILILLICLFAFLVIWSLFKSEKYFSQQQKEDKNEEAKKNEAKQKLDTGDAVTDFNNSIDILSKLKS